MIGASGLTDESPVTMPDVLGAEDVDEREELLADQRLDRRGVVGASAVGEGAKRARRSRRATCRCRSACDRMTFAPETISIDRLVLRGVQGQASIGRPVDETAVGGVRVRAPRATASRRERGTTRVCPSTASCLVPDRERRRRPRATPCHAARPTACAETTAAMAELPDDVDVQAAVREHGSPIAPI